MLQRLCATVITLWAFGCAGEDRSTAQAGAESQQSAESQEARNAPQNADARPRSSAEDDMQRDPRAPATDAGVEEGPNDRYVSERHEIGPQGHQSGAEAAEQPATIDDREGTAPPEDGGERRFQIEQLAYKTDANKLAQLLFAAADRDRNQQLSSQEYVSMAQAYFAAEKNVESVGQPSAGGDAIARATKAFNSASGEDEEITSVEFRTAFLDRFDVADANLDDVLNDEERLTFRRLMTGEVADQDPNQPPSDR